MWKILPKGGSDVRRQEGRPRLPLPRFVVLGGNVLTRFRKKGLSHLCMRRGAEGLPESPLPSSGDAN